MDINIAVGFGSVLVLALIGAAVHWYLGRREHGERPDRPGATGKDSINHVA